MELVTSIPRLRELRAAARAAGKRVALVPTMGYLHEGHLALVDEAARRADLVWVTIFVNPMQFGPAEDLTRYPRDLDRDLGLLAPRRVAAVFTPSPEAIYPAGFATSIDVGEVAAPLEGTLRPGHFRGVATVVAKLFNLTEPEVAIFGQKDYQQSLVVRRMAADLDLPIEIFVAPTVREADGLAMSSRNAYLSPAERVQATILYRSLEAGAAAAQRGAAASEAAMRAVLALEPALGLEYAVARNAETLAEVRPDQPPGVLLIAARLGKTRLIDNWVLENPA